MFRFLVIALLLLGAVTARAAEVRIQGLRQISEFRALELLGDRLIYVRARPANAARANDAAFFLRRLLVRDGFVNAEVSSRVVNPNLIVLFVDEGVRLTLGNISFRGVNDPEREERLARLFAQPATKRASAFGADLPFLEEDVAEALDSVHADFQARGYWDAQVRIAGRNVTPLTGEVNFLIDVDAGPLFFIGPSVVQGDLAGHDAEIAALLAGFRGRVADTASLNGARDAVETFYRTRGYEFAQVEVGAAQIGNVYTMLFRIDAGRQYRVGEIALLGLGRTNPDRVGARFAGLQGRLYDQSEFNEPITKLLGTGAFQSIRTERQLNDDGTIDVELHLTEGRARGITTYAGAGSFEGFIFGASYFDRNFLGQLWNLNVGGEISSRGLLGEVRLTDPWFLDTETHASGRLFLITRDYDGYDKGETGASVTFTWDITDHYEISLTAASSYVDITADGIPVADLGETIYGHHRVNLLQQFDFRDNPLSPRRGFYGRILTELGTALGTESTGYFKAEGQASYYLPVGDENHFAFGLRSGLIIPSRDNGRLPIDLRFFQGGPDSVRSFPKRELGDLAASGAPLGGEAYWTANVEYIHHIAGPLKGVIFTDVGTLSRTFDDFGFDNAEVAVGAGLRLDLPIGPIRLEYGHNLSRDPREPSGTFHFAIGTAF